MIVLDASVVANIVADVGPLGTTAREQIRTWGELAAPDLVDVETVSVLRKRWLHGDLGEREFATALDDLEDLEIRRFATLPLMRRAYALRANLTAYEATYVSLAEGLGCPVATIDLRLARAPGPTCDFVLVSADAPGS